MGRFWKTCSAVALGLGCGLACAGELNEIPPQGPLVPPPPDDPAPKPTAAAPAQVAPADGGVKLDQPVLELIDPGQPPLRSIAPRYTKGKKRFRIRAKATLAGPAGDEVKGFLRSLEIEVDEARGETCEFDFRIGAPRALADGDPKSLDAAGIAFAGRAKAERGFVRVSDGKLLKQDDPEVIQVLAVVWMADPMPAEPVGVGATWSVRFSTETPEGILTRESKYRLVAVGTDQVAMDVDRTERLKGRSQVSTGRLTFTPESPLPVGTLVSSDRVQIPSPTGAATTAKVTSELIVEALPER